MLNRRGRSIAAAVSISAVAAVAAAGCGSSSTKTVTTSSGASASGGSTTGGGSGGGSGSGGGGGSNALAGISPPPGSQKLASKSGSGVVYERYSTSTPPAGVVSSYNHQLTSMGWTIVNKGGSGGGWGPYGGSSSGLTAKKREDEFVDVQAGGQRGQKTYFEVCATSSTGNRATCDSFSDEANHRTQSGGSHSGSNSHTTTSGGS